MRGQKVADRLRDGLAAALGGHSIVAAFGLSTYVQLCFRRKGARLARVWGDGAGLEAAGADAVARAMPAADLAADRITHIEVTVARAGRLMGQADLGRARANDFRGLMGIALGAPGKTVRMVPIEMLTRNLGPKAALRTLSREIGLPLTQLEPRAFPADQFLIE